MKETAQQAESGFFEDLQAGLLEGIAHFRGEIELKTTTVTIPDPPPTYDAEHIRTLRTGLGFSQPYFSRLLNVSPKTVQSWEQGTRVPSQSSARLLQLIENPHLLDSLRHPQQISPQQISPQQISPQQISPQQISPQQISPQQISPSEAAD